MDDKAGIKDAEHRSWNIAASRSGLTLNSHLAEMVYLLYHTNGMLFEWSSPPRS
jgi:hypothetical protein